MENKIDHCILHIGLEKTGSTTIQNFLYENRHQLLQQKVLYTSSAGKRNQYGYAAIALEDVVNSYIALILGIHSEEDFANYRRKLIANLDFEFQQASGCEKVIISSEFFHSRLVSAKQIANLKLFLDKWVNHYTVMFYIRRQDRLAVSRYSTKLLQGEKDGVFGFDIGGEYYYQYDEIYKNWSSVFGEHNVIVRMFDPKCFSGGNLIQDFCQVVGVNAESLLIPDKRENVSLGVAETFFMKEVADRIPAWQGRERNKLYKEISLYIRQRSSGKHYPVTAKQAIEFYERFRISNEWLKSKLFPSKSGTLFNESFDDYPDVAPVDLNESIESREILDIALGFAELQFNKRIEAEERASKRKKRFKLRLVVKVILRMLKRILSFFREYYRMLINSIMRSF